MSDFLVTFGPEFKGSALLRLARQMYPAATPPHGEAFDFPWGAIAVLHDPVQCGRNIHQRPRGLFASVGDLVLGAPDELADRLLERRIGWRKAGATGMPANLESDPDISRLNGAYAVVMADATGPGLITDPLGSVQIYAGHDNSGRLAALGTHPDLVAVLSRNSRDVDPTSAFEFLNNGTPCFPHTMHPHVHELAAGHVHEVFVQGEPAPRIQGGRHWPFPDEFEVQPSEADLAESLSHAFRSAVADRSQGRQVAVTLSGGLDSRVIIASVPRDAACSAFTFADVMNREARTAQRVAGCYQREWVPLYRDPDFIARTAIDTIRFTGCEGDWVNAHGLGFAREFNGRGVTSVLTGLLMNNVLRGYYAADMKRVARAGRLLPPQFEFVPFDYPNAIEPFDGAAFPVSLLESSRARRRRFVEGHPGLKRQSKAEWLDGYPFSQASDNTAWVAERRVMPVRLPAMDRRVLDIACRIPMRTKAEGRMFGRMARTLLGPGARIPNANDGVRPGSSHFSSVLQKAVRRSADRGKKVLGRLGVDFPVPHSWHDYQRYWRESSGLRDLVDTHIRNLDSLEGSVFSRSPQSILGQPSLHWLYCFRMLQLGAWKSILAGYRAHAA